MLNVTWDLSSRIYSYSFKHYLLRDANFTAIKGYFRPGMVVYTCNPITLEGRGGRITRSGDPEHPGQYGETPSLLKIQKITRAWWQAPVVPATWEAEAGEWRELARWSLQWAEMVPLHSSLGDRAKNSLSIKRKNAIQNVYLPGD